MVFITVREASVRSQSARHQQRVERTRQQAALLSRFAARTYRDAKTTQQELVREDMRQAWLKEKSDTVSTLRNAQSLARTLHGCSRRAAQAYTAELSHIAKDTAKRWDQYETLVQKRAALGATYFRAEGVINDAGARQRVERIQQVREREDRRAKMITEGVTRIRDGRATDDLRPAGVRRSSSAGVASFPGGVYRVEWASSSARTISARRRAEEVAHKLQADQEARRTQDAERNYKAVVRGRSSLHALYVQAEERRNLEHAEELERARKEKKVREITRDPLVVDFMDREVRRSQNLSRCLHREFQRTFLFPESGWHVPKDEPPATSRIAPVHYMDPCTKSQSAVASCGPLSGQGGSEATLLSMPLPESDQSSLDKSGEPLLLYDVLPYSNPPEGETATLSMLLNQESR